MNRNRQKLMIWLLAGFFTALSFIAHFTSPSSMHYSEEHWQECVKLHQTHPVFKVRPFTTNIVLLLNNVFGLPQRTAFFALQYILLLISGPVFQSYLRRLGFEYKPAVWGMAIYFLSLPVLMAHFDPVYTWSDFWTYLFIPLSFTFLIRRKYIPAILAFMCAILARETTLIFLPVWFLFIYRLENRHLMQPITYTLLIIILFLSIRIGIFGFIGGDFGSYLAFNFENFLRSSDTVFSLCVALGFVWVFGLYQALCRTDKHIRHYSLIRFGGVLSSCGFIISALLLAQARETRLFFPPFVFLIPLTLMYFQEHRESLGHVWRRFSYASRIAIMIIIFGFSVAVVHILFPEFEFRAWKDGSRMMLAIHLGITLTVIALQAVRYRSVSASK